MIVSLTGTLTRWDRDTSVAWLEVGGGDHRGGASLADHHGGADVDGHDLLLNGQLRRLMFADQHAHLLGDLPEALGSGGFALRADYAVPDGAGVRTVAVDDAPARDRQTRVDTEHPSCE